MASNRIAVLGTLAALIGCSGQLGSNADLGSAPPGSQAQDENSPTGNGEGPNAPDTPDSPNSPNSPGEPAEFTSVIDDPDEQEALDATPAVATECQIGGAPPVHRLSRTEYLNTMRALFPGYTGDLSFPADNALPGFENEAEMLHANGLLVEAVANNAEKLSAYAVQDMASLVGCTPQTADEEAECARTFIADVGLRALRQPLSTALVDEYMSVFTQYRDSIDFEAGIQLTLSAMLQAPELMYRLSPRTLTPDVQPSQAVSFAAASRLAYALWQAPPDQALLDAAANGGLDTPEEIREQLALMTLRTPDKQAEALRDFHRQWLDLDRILDDQWNFKDTQMFPEWTPEMVTSVHEESLAFVDEVMVQQQGTLSDLLTSRTARVDANTAGLYDLPSSTTGVTELDDPRAGIFARASFLASHGHQRNGSPPLRGIGIMERAFCMSPGQPPPNANTSNPADEADASQFTNRELFERRAADEPCNSCHRVINPFAYPLEAFDAIGRFRTTDNGKPVNTETDLMGTDIDGNYADWQATAAAMADSEMVRACASEQWAEFAFGRKVQPEEGCMVADLTDGIAAGESFLNIMKRAAQYAAAAETQ